MLSWINSCQLCSGHPGPHFVKFLSEKKGTYGNKKMAVIDCSFIAVHFPRLSVVLNVKCYHKKLNVKYVII